MRDIQLIFASNNQYKLKEVREIIGDDFEVMSVRDIGFEGDIPETGETIEGNAMQKARFLYEKMKMNCFADDTGLEIDALDGRPGVYSARYAGEGCSFDENVRKVLTEMEGVEERNARFRCVICLILDGEEYLFEGRVNGVIAKERTGNAGFGYDPVFIPEGYHQSFSEMPAHLKNGISHRGRAMWKMMKFIKRTSGQADKRTSGQADGRTKEKRTRD